MPTRQQVVASRTRLRTHPSLSSCGGIGRTGGLTVRTALRAGTADLNQEIIEQLKGFVQRLSSMTDAS